MGNTPLSGESNMKGLVPRFGPWLAAVVNEWVANQSKQIHGTNGIFIFMKTIKTNHSCVVNIPYIDDMGNNNQHHQLTVDFLARRLRIGHAFRQACFIHYRFLGDVLRWLEMMNCKLQKKVIKVYLKDDGLQPENLEKDLYLLQTCCLKVLSSWWWVEISLNPGKGCILTAITSLQRHHTTIFISMVRWLPFFSRQALISGSVWEPRQGD